MNAQALSFGAGQRPPTPRKIAPLAAIVVAHLVLFYLAQAGLLSRAVHAALPQVVEISFVAPPKPVAPPPKTVPVVQHVASVTPPPLPLLATPQIEPTITTPPPQAPRSVEAPVVAAAPTVEPAPPQPAAPKLVSGVEYLRAPQPNYPPRSRRLGETGVVILRVLINERGLPEQVRIEKSSGFSALDEEGLVSVQHTLFKPKLEDGKPVAVYALVPVNFQQGRG